MKTLQLRQFEDFGRNWPYTKSRQNSEKRELVNWFTAFDLEIRLQDLALYKKKMKTNQWKKGRWQTSSPQV
jgi:hypothetical protein